MTVVRQSPWGIRMKSCIFRLAGIGVAILLGGISTVCAQNQTPDVSPILPEDSLPLRISIEQADFSLPSGVQSYVAGTFGGRWLILAGRINGLHGFNNDNSNFPPNQQNSTVFVVDPVQKTVATRSLTAPGSGLTQSQVDLLSVTSAQSYQLGNTLYVTGGYGVDTATGNFSTKDALSAIDVPSLIQWVFNASPGDTAAQHIRQIRDPIFLVTGGEMKLGAGGVTMLMFGQNFVGANVISANGTYMEQVSRFRIVDDGVSLSVVPLGPLPALPDPNYRRRDLNIVPLIRDGNDVGWVALSGVFTTANGVWTVPVDIATDGTPSMADPANPATFKQGMNGYASANFGAYSPSTRQMYTILLGGISFGYFANGAFVTDAELPFINQITTIRHGSDGSVSQYLMSSEYPFIASTGSNPGNQLLFGARAHLFADGRLPAFGNGVLDLDQLGGSQPRVLGYIVGGIMSTLPNTNTQSDSAASPYIFKVTLTSTLMPAVVQGPPIPTLSQWGLLVLALFVGVLGLALHRTSSMKI
jgi:hypothetical protein